MMKRKKRAKKFGPRYGKKLRERREEIELKQSKRYKCPSCGKKSLARKAAGVWKCKSCGHKVAGKAYSL